jgi:hypothetical protein
MKLTFDVLDEYALDRLSAPMKSLVESTMRDYDTGGKPTHIAYTDLDEVALAWPMKEYGSRLVTIHPLQGSGRSEPDEFLVDFSDKELEDGVETKVTL